MFSEPEITGVKKSKESLFELKGNLVISAVKKAENRKGIIIRLYNAKHAISESAYINFTRPIIYAAYLNLLEEEIGLPERDNNKVKLISIGPSKFVSLYVEVK
jgi:mannosylglycerate hydrolase